MYDLEQKEARGSPGQSLAIFLALVIAKHAEKNHLPYMYIGAEIILSLSYY